MPVITQASTGAEESVKNIDLDGACDAGAGITTRDCLACVVGGQDRSFTASLAVVAFVKAPLKLAKTTLELGQHCWG